MEAVKLYREPKLRNPSMIAAWPGMGGVALVAAKYLKERLGAREFGLIEPHDFFDPTMVLVEEGVTNEPELPESRLYLWESGGGDDLIIFIGESQPSTGSYRLANLILEVAQRFKVKRVYTFAAAPTHIHHTRKPGVLGAATSPKLVEELKGLDISLLKEGSISGMNGLLLGVARETNMDGICLLGEIPVYTTHIANPRSSMSVLEVLCQILGLEIDMTEIDSWARKTEEEIEEHIERLRESYGEQVQGIFEYFEQLKQQTSEEEARVQREEWTDELLQEIEKLLQRGEDKEGN